MVDEVDVESVDVADKIVDELESTNALLMLGKRVHQLKIWVLKNL